MREQLQTARKVVQKKQYPKDFPQKFNGSSTALQVLQGKDLTGQVAIITGANTGIGFETARSLALHGCHVVFACRNLSLAEEAIEKIRMEPEAGKCEALRLDLSSLRDVVAFSDVIKKKFNAVDMLVLNAGLFGVSYSKTKDGYERIYQVCHLSHFYLTLLLQPVLKEGSRVVVVSSESHRCANLTAETISPTTLSPDADKYWDVMAYNNAKLCNVLFVQELARRWRQQGVSVFSLHPGGFVSSNISRNWWMYRLVFAILRPFTKSLQQAASTTVYCATSNDLDHATELYFNDCHYCEPSPASQDQDLAQTLWKISLDMIREVLGSDAPGIPKKYDLD